MANTAVLNVAIVVDTTPAQTVQERYIGDSLNPRDGVQRLADLLQRLASGLEVGKVHVHVDKADGTQATMTIACTQASAVQGDTVTIGDTTLTIKTSPSSDPGLGQFAAGASNTAMGNNLAAAVNAHPKLKGRCTAANAAGTVTLTMADKGLFGTSLRMTETGGSMVVTNPTNGAVGTQQSGMRTYRCGR